MALEAELARLSARPDDHGSFELVSERDGVEGVIAAIVAAMVIAGVDAGGSG